MIKDGVVPLFPNLPCSNDEDFHKEGILKLLLSMGHHLEEEVHGRIPLNAEVLPAGLTKRTTKEKMKGCFLHTVIAKNTIVVVSFPSLFFLLRMFLVYSLSIRSSLEMTLSLLLHLDSQIQMKGAGG